MRVAHGTKRFRSETKALLLAAWRISLSPVRQERAISLQVPGQERVEPRSLARMRATR